jgi:SAM-dependent methyltransferase
MLSADLHNVSFRMADAQVHRFQRARFDLCISRFGTMFFADPVAAFPNIGLALRPGGRLVMLVWQAADRNEWSSVLRRAHTAGPDPFSLADRPTTEGILAAAGFDRIAFTEVHEPVYYGPDSATAYDAVLQLQPAEEVRPRLRAPSPRTTPTAASTSTPAPG